jgi:homoserine O-succinyltransferase
MIDFRAKAVSDRKPELLADFPADQLAKDVQNVWRPTAGRIYRNLLLYMASQRAGRTRPAAHNGRFRVSPLASRWPPRQYRSPIEKASDHVPKA